MCGDRFVSQQLARSALPPIAQHNSMIGVYFLFSFQRKKKKNETEMWQIRHPTHRTRCQSLGLLFDLWLLTAAGLINYLPRHNQTETHSRRTLAIQNTVPGAIFFVIKFSLYGCTLRFVSICSVWFSVKRKLDFRLIGNAFPRTSAWCGDVLELQHTLQPTALATKLC